MARARMLAPSISTDARVRELPLGGQLLFTWMIAHADNCGRLHGDPFYLMAVVVPYVPDVTEADIERWLGKMADLGLIDWYEVAGSRYVRFRGWEKHQRLNRMKQSDLPAPPEGGGWTPPASTGVQSTADGRLKGREGAYRGEVVEEIESEREGVTASHPSSRNPRAASPTAAPPPPTRTEKPHPPRCVCDICCAKWGPASGERTT